MQPTRDFAVSVVLTERNYQDAIHPETVPLHAYLSLIDKYIERARAKLGGPDDPMEDMRKIAALALRTIEIWGAPFRAITGQAHIRDPLDNLS